MKGFKGKKKKRKRVENRIQLTWSNQFQRPYKTVCDGISYIAPRIKNLTRIWRESHRECSREEEIGRYEAVRYVLIHIASRKKYLTRMWKESCRDGSKERSENHFILYEKRKGDMLNRTQ